MIGEQPYRQATDTVPGPGPGPAQAGGTRSQGLARNINLHQKSAPETNSKAVSWPFGCHWGVCSGRHPWRLSTSRATHTARCTKAYLPNSGYCFVMLNEQYRDTRAALTLGIHRVVTRRTVQQAVQHCIGYHPTSCSALCRISSSASHRNSGTGAAVGCRPNTRHLDALAGLSSCVKGTGAVRFLVAMCPASVVR